MAAEENKAIVRRWFEEVWNQRNVAAIDALAAESFTLHHVALPSAIDLQTYKHYHPAFMAAFPDFHVEIDDIIAEGIGSRCGSRSGPRIKGSSWASHPLASR